MTIAMSTVEHRICPEVLPVRCVLPSMGSHSVPTMITQEVRRPAGYNFLVAAHKTSLRTNILFLQVPLCASLNTKIPILYLIILRHSLQTGPLSGPEGMLAG